MKNDGGAAWTAFEATRFSQLQMETKEAFHQAVVMSVKLEEKDIAGWNEIIRAMEKAHPGKIDILGENRTLNLETIRESMKKKTAMIVLSIKKTDRPNLFMEVYFFCRTIRCGNAFLCLLHRSGG